MKYITALILFVITMTLIGCATPTPITISQNIVVSPPDNLMLDCFIEPPPDKASFEAAADKDRVAMLAKVASSQIKDNDVCNKRLSQLRDWVKQQNAIYNTSKTPGGGG
jgi:hypothetical protein